MGKVSDRQASILAQQSNELWPGYVNMLKVLTEVFQSPKHWVLEFLQNAEDAKASSMSIRLDDKRLCILNNGDVFSDEDFSSICTVRSRKLPALGFRGYYGIGFKSIFRITKQGSVHSGEYHFEFNQEHWHNNNQSRRDPDNPWPWEILPIETLAAPIPSNYKTLFEIPFEDQTSLPYREELEEYFTVGNFPKEAILVLKNISLIEIKSRGQAFEVTKSVKSTRQEPFGIVELTSVQQETSNDKFDQSDYLVIRKKVTVPTDIQQDEETNRHHRAGVREREIGLVFGIGTSGRPEKLQGNLAGVYSFLPIEGEQTGLPFGIFGDYIPQPGRDLIKYDTRWNDWISEELVGLFTETLTSQIKSDPAWIEFGAQILTNLNRAPTTGPGEDFWRAKLRTPIENFLKQARLYPDASGTLSNLEDLIYVEPEVLDIVGVEIIEEATGKKVLNQSVATLLQYRVAVLDIYNILTDSQVPIALKTQPKKLAAVYALIMNLSDYMVAGREGRSAPMSQFPFVLGEDGELHNPDKVMMLETALSQMPTFLRSVVSDSSIALHPVIAENPVAVSGLARCGMQRLDKYGILQLLGVKLNAIRNAADVPTSWKFPDDVVNATHFIISLDAGGTPSPSLNGFISQDEVTEVPQNLFASGTILDWGPLYLANLLPGWRPIHEMYLNDDLLKRHGIGRDGVYQYFQKHGVRGFTPENDRPLIETAAMAKAKLELQRAGHELNDVSNHNLLGYDLECRGHCEAVFEIKGMGQPRDVELPVSETAAAQNHGEDFHLVFIYNIPSTPDNIGCKIVRNPAGRSLLEPLERSKITSDKWMNAEL